MAFDYITARKKYAPYDRYESFDRGVSGFFANRRECPYPRQSIDAQAWDRGQELAMLILTATHRK